MILFGTISFNFWLNRPETKSFEEQKQIAAFKISQVFQKKANKLSATKRGHFYVRLYRTSGNSEYLEEIRKYAQKLSEEFKRHAENLDNADYIRELETSYLSLSEKPLSKHLYRVRYRTLWPNMTFAHRLLSLGFQLRALGLDQGALAPDFEKVIRYLKSLSYEEYLSDSDIIRYNATRTVNMVYQLKYLGVQDLEEKFLEHFKKVFFAAPDQSLDVTTYLNKMYGLTHILIGVSNFYEKRIPDTEYRWIDEYLSENISQILIRTNPDIAAEIAVCFKLAGRDDDPAVIKIQEYLLTKIDWRRGYIPVSSKKSDLDAAEHRNILAYMTFTKWDELFPGPDLLA